MKARILLRKLNFLANLLSKEDCLSSNIFQTQSSQNVYEISLVQQCRSLELQFGTNFLRECLDNPSEAPVVIQVAKADILVRVGAVVYVKQDLIRRCQLYVRLT